MGLWDLAKSESKSGNHTIEEELIFRKTKFTRCIIVNNMTEEQIEKVRSEVAELNSSTLSSKYKEYWHKKLNKI